MAYFIAIFSKTYHGQPKIVNIRSFSHAPSKIPLRSVLSLPFNRILLELSYCRLKNSNNLKAYLTN